MLLFFTFFDDKIFCTLIIEMFFFVLKIRSSDFIQLLIVFDFRNFLVKFFDWFILIYKRVLDKVPYFLNKKCRHEIVLSSKMFFVLRSFLHPTLRIVM